MQAFWHLPFPPRFWLKSRTRRRIMAKARTPPRHRVIPIRVIPIRGTPLRAIPVRAMRQRTATSKPATPKRQTMRAKNATTTAAKQARAKPVSTTVRTMLDAEISMPTTANPMRAVMMRAVMMSGAIATGFNSRMTMIAAALPCGMIRISGH